METKRSRHRLPFASVLSGRIDFRLRGHVFSERDPETPCDLNEVEQSMIVLGLSMAHDAGVAIIEDGRIRGIQLRERFVRKKRCALLTAEFIDESLRKYGLSWADVDSVAVASAQSWPFIFVDPDAFSFRLDDPQTNTFGFSTEERRGQADGQKHIRRRQASAVRRLGQVSTARWSEYLVDDLTGLNLERCALANMEWSYAPKRWSDPFQRSDIASWATEVDRLQTVRFGYQPIQVTLFGKVKPGLIVPHHLAHAALSFYQSDQESGAVYTLDNGDVRSPELGYLGGLFAYGEGTRIIPLGPNFAYHGHLYQRVAEAFNLGHGGGAGKLMGLAPFGQPVFDSPEFVGNAYEVFGQDYAHGSKPDRFTVLDKLTARSQQLASSLYSDPKAPTEHHLPDAYGAEHLRRVEVDVAATAQAVFEACTINDVTTLAGALRDNGFGTRHLSLGGGGALNCPTNSRVLAACGHAQVFVPPACDDSGLGAGAALALMHDVLGRPRVSFAPDSTELAYQGIAYSTKDVESAVSDCGEAVRQHHPTDPAAAAASDLASGKIIGWFEGRSEIGPRALGHRSILADPRPKTQWKRVNELKSREYWRPFAPAVLREHASDWFDGAPDPSPFMLFTARVRSSDVPAITHVDGSSCIQTVDSSCGAFHRVVDAFHRETGTPMVLNTSFNGPAEPIVEAPADALRFLRSSKIDAVYLDGVRVTRADRQE